MRPHPDDFDDAFFFVNLVDEPVLDVDAPGICAGEVSDEFFIRRRVMERVFFKDFEEGFGLRLEPCGGELEGVLSGVSRENQPPLYHFSVLEHFSGGVLRPFLMDSRMPGTDSRYRVSCTADQSSAEINTALLRFPVICTGSSEAAASSMSL